MYGITTIGDFRNCVPSWDARGRRVRQWAAMNDHSHFEELAALEAGGFQSGDELMELREHAKDCVECRNAQEEFSGLVCSGLPQTVSPIREFMDKVKRPGPTTVSADDSSNVPGSKASLSLQTSTDQSGIPGGELASSFQLRPHWSPRLSRRSFTERIGIPPPGNPCRHSSRSSSSSGRTPRLPRVRRLNAAAFTTPPPGDQGDLGRNYFRGFPINQTDLAVSRRFGLSERFSLYFRVEYFNVFNHPMFAPPSANFNNYLTQSSFGIITSTLNNFLSGGPGTLSPLYQIGGPRSGQLTLKLLF